jgi:hypothetical protein
MLFSIPQNIQHQRKIDGKKIIPEIGIKQRGFDKFYSIPTWILSA